MDIKDLSWAETLKALKASSILVFSHFKTTNNPTNARKGSYLSNLYTLC